MGIIGLLAIIGLVVALTTVIWSGWRTARSSAVLPIEATEALRRAGHRALAACATATATFVAMIAWANADDAAALVLALAPTVSCTVGLLTYAAVPAPAQRRTTTRSASLTPRVWWNQRPRGVVIALGAVLVVTTSVLVTTGMTGSVDEHGNAVIAREFRSGPVSSMASGPYPAWPYALPLLVGTAALVAATILAMRRVSTTAALSRPELQHADAAWRRGAVAVVALVALTGALATLAGVLFVTGSAVRNVFGDAPSAWAGLGSGLMIAGGLLAIAALVSIALAGLRSVGLINATLSTADAVPA